MHILVLMSGGFHPFHPGHLALYNSAKQSFPGADVVVGATNDTDKRPFNFKDKATLATIAGVDNGHFVEVNRQFTVKGEPNIENRIQNPDDTVLILVRSLKDSKDPALQPWKPNPDGSAPMTKGSKNHPPRPTSNYLLSYKGNEKQLQPMTKHAYIAFLPVQEFGGDMTSASEIRNEWPTLDEQGKINRVISLYPATKQNGKLLKTVMNILNRNIGGLVMQNTSAIKQLKTNKLKEQIQRMRPLIKEASIEQKYKMLKLIKEAVQLNELFGKKEVADESLLGFLTKPEPEVKTKSKISSADMRKYFEKEKAKEPAKHNNDTKQKPQQVFTRGVDEARTNPDRNRRSGSGKYDLINYAEDNISDKDNWAVSMTMEPKLGINPRAAVSEDTPKGIYFYPLRYFMQMADRDESLPWGDNFSYLQLFQYDRSGEMTKETQVDPAKLKQALLQYCPEEVIQQASEEDEYDGTPYWFIYDCLSRLGLGDETNVIRWNKVLRDLGFTSVYDDGKGWIAYNEPTQGVVLDPRIIKQHKMFDNRNPTLQHKRYDLEGLANSIEWSSYYQRERQIQRVPYNHPDEEKVRLAVAKSMLKPFLGKSSEEAKEMGYNQALKAAADKVIEILKQPLSEDYLPEK